MGYATDDIRCMSERYNYFIRGRKVVIIEWKNSLVVNDCDPQYQGPSGGPDTLLGNNIGKEGILNGLLLQMTAIPDLDELLNETDDIPVNDVLSMALVDYVKAALIEDPKDQTRQLYYMQKFKDRVAKYNSRKVGGARTVSGNSYMR